MGRVFWFFFSFFKRAELAWPFTCRGIVRRFIEVIGLCISSFIEIFELARIKEAVI